MKSYLVVFNFEVYGLSLQRNFYFISLEEVYCYFGVSSLQELFVNSGCCVTFYEVKDILLKFNSFEEV